MLIGLIILALVVIGLIVAFATFVVFWMMMVVFWGSAIVLALIVQDPHLGFFLAFPATGLIFWLYSLNARKPSGPDHP